jgi:hypothetical protein
MVAPPHSVSTLTLSSARARRRISCDHLLGQFARGAQHQRLHRETPRVEVGQQRQRKGGRLAAARLRLRDEVTAGQRQRQAGRLDGRHALVAQALQVVQHVAGQGQAVERGAG